MFVIKVLIKISIIIKCVRVNFKMKIKFDSRLVLFYAITGLKNVFLNLISLVYPRLADTFNIGCVQTRSHNRPLGLFDNSWTVKRYLRKFRARFQ